MSEDLFDRILECEVFRQVFANGRSEESQACATVVRSQGVPSLQEFQVPEPWNGTLSAKLLFLSSNPGFDPNEDYPRVGSSDPEPRDFFRHRFSKGRASLKWVSDLRVLYRDGTRASRAPQYWLEVKNAAAVLLDCPVDALRWGEDFALSEVVHCKSKANAGVQQALQVCSRRYLEPLLVASAARVVVWYGLASEAFALLTGRRAGLLEGPVDLCGRARYLLFLPAPGAGQPRRPDVVLKADDLAKVRHWLATRGP